MKSGTDESRISFWRIGKRKETWNRTHIK